MRATALLARDVRARGQILSGVQAALTTRARHARAIVGQQVTTDDGITVYRTKQTQTYTPQLNRLLAESLLAPPTEGGWLQQVGAVVTAFTNRTVQSVIYYASDLHALAVGDSNDPLVLLR